MGSILDKVYEREDEGCVKSYEKRFNIGDKVNVNNKLIIPYSRDTSISYLNKEEFSTGIITGVFKDGYKFLLDNGNGVECWSYSTDIHKLNPSWESQIGGNHYKDMIIQPMEYSMKNNLNALQHTIIKYVSRYKDKNGVQDLEKAKHCIEMLIDYTKLNP